MFSSIHPKIKIPAIAVAIIGTVLGVLGAVTDTASAKDIFIGICAALAPLVIGYGTPGGKDGLEVDLNTVTRDDVREIIKDKV